MNYKILIVFFSFIFLDFITGLIKAFKTGTFSSTYMREGLFHKLSEFLVLIFAYLIDYSAPLYFPSYEIKTTFIVTGYIVLMECGSIIENIGAIYPPLKKILTTVFEKFNEKG